MRSRRRDRQRRLAEVRRYRVVVGAAEETGRSGGFARVRNSRLRTAFQVTLPDSLKLLSGGLRIGFGLDRAMQTVIREGAEPAAEEFGRALHDIRLGACLEDALDAVADRMNSSDLRLVVVAIRTVGAVGGGLTDVLDTAVLAMRERMLLTGQLSTRAVDGRHAAPVLAGPPARRRPVATLSR